MNPFFELKLDPHTKMWECTVITPKPMPDEFIVEIKCEPEQSRHHLKRHFFSKSGATRWGNEVVQKCLEVK